MQRLFLLVAVMLLSGCLTLRDPLIISPKRNHV